MHEIIQQNYAGFIISGFLIIFILTNSNFEKKINRLFLFSGLCVLALVVADAWEAQLALEPAPSELRIIMSAIGYIMRPATAYFIVMIFFRDNNKRLFLFSIPMILNVLTVFSALFCPLAFSYTPENHFVRGPLGFVPFITSAFYVVMLLVITAMRLNKGYWHDALTVALIAVVSLIATLMESLMGYDAFLSSSCGICVTFYYLYFHTSQNNRDPLTGAMTRRRFYLDARKKRATLTGVISLDLNDLKVLNDSKGHDAGDEALIAMANAIQKTLPRGGFLYRTGGDEFMILCNKMTDEECRMLLRRIDDEMSRTTYKCAVGYSYYDEDEGLDAACIRADAAMYENKAEMKGDNAHVKYRTAEREEAKI